MRIQESLVTDKQIALELFSENGKFRLPIDGKDYFFPTLEKVHEAFLNQTTYDTIKLTHEGKKSYLHLFMDEIEVFDTKKALRQRLSQDSQGMWAEIRNGQKHYYKEERGWMSTSYKEITEKECIEKLERTSTMTKALGIGLGMLALLPGAFEFARHLPIGTKEAAMGLIALNQKSPVLGALGYSLLPSKAEAQALGTEFQVNTYTTDAQDDPSIAALKNGGFVVTWTSNNQDGDGYGIYGQRYGSNGAKNGTEFQVNTYTADLQEIPSITALTDGGFVIIWASDGQDGSWYGIFGQRYDSGGVAAGNEFQINTYTTSYQSLPSVAGLADGGFVASWTTDGQDGAFYGIYAQRYTSTGAKISSEFQVNTYTKNYQDTPSITALEDGGFVIIWESQGQDGSSDGIFGQRYDSNGVAAGNEFRVNTYTSNYQQNPSVAALGDGGFVVTWTSNGQDGANNGVYGQRYNSSGVKNGLEFQINTYTTNFQWFPSVAALQDGGFVVTWQSNGQDGDAYGIFGQRYDSNGAKSGLEFQINTYTTGSQQYPSATGLADGGFVVTWESNGQDGNSFGIYGQRYDASGNPIPLQISTSISQTPNLTPGSPSQNTATPSLVTTQSSLTGPTYASSYITSPSLVTTRRIDTSLTATVSPSQTPNGSRPLPSNATLPTPGKSDSLLSSISASSAGPTSDTLATVTTQPTIVSSTTTSNNMSSSTMTMSGTPLTSSKISSPTTGSNIQTALSTKSSSKATSTSAASGIPSSTPTIASLENIVYGESYPLFNNGEIIGTYTVSGGTGLLDSGNPNVISFEFDSTYQPEEGESITLFYIPEEDVALWESIEIEGEDFDCLMAQGQVATNQGRSSYQMVFEDTECLAIASTMLATALPLTLN